MIEFRCRRRDKTNTPILYNEEVRSYAEMVVGDYKPELLKEPGKINGLHFIESYLGATVEYQDIFYAEGESPIAGATIFNDDKLLVFDRESMCVKAITVPANTIVLDNKTVCNGNDAFANFTALHEGGHMCMHAEVFRRKAQEASICCRRVDVLKSYANKQEYTPEMSREHQANTFAAFASMPRQTFIPYASNLIKEIGFKKGVFIFDDKGGWEYPHYLNLLIAKLSGTYGTSHTAVAIHLKELGLLMRKQEYDRMRSKNVIQ